MRARLKQFVRGGVEAALRRRGHSPAMRREAGRELAWWKSARVEAMRRRRPLVEGRAIVWAEPGRVELARVEVPLAGPREVTVLTEASVVSPGTERAYYLRLPDARPAFPYFPGYSLAGRAAAVGSDVEHVREGDPVAAVRTRHASVATVRADRIFPVPPGVDIADAAFVYLGVICGGAVSRAEIDANETVCVVGAGPIGVLCQRLASARGAGEVTVVARSRRHAALAAAGGAAFVLAEGAGESLASVVFDATGDPSAFPLAVRLAAPGGRVVVVGSPRGAGEVPLAEVARKRLRVLGAHVENLSTLSERFGRDLGREEAERFLEAIQSGTVAVADLVDEVVDPREAERFYRRLARDELAGARIDWTALPDAERMRPRPLLRPPRLGAHGVDFRGAAVEQPATSDARTDPFAGAAGMLRVGLLGCGDIGLENAAAVAAAPNSRLVACYDPERALAEAVVSRFGAEAAPSTEALLARADLDAVFLAVPHHLHAPLGALAAEAGLHVIVEKPLARTLAEAQELADAVARHGVTGTVCFPQRFDPHAVRARELVAAGALGEVTGALVVWFADKPESYWIGGYSGRSVSAWRGTRELAGGGVLLMNLSHFIDLVRVIGGVEALEVAAVGRTPTDAEVEDHVSMSVRYENAAVGSFLGSSAARGAIDEQVQLWGADGHLVLWPKPRVYTLRSGLGVGASRWHGLPVDERVDPRAVFVSRFATALANGDQPDVSLEDGLAVQAVIEAAYRSEATGETVRVADLLGAHAGR